MRKRKYKQNEDLLSQKEIETYRRMIERYYVNYSTRLDCHVRLIAKRVGQQEDQVDGWGNDLGDLLLEQFFEFDENFNGDFGNFMAYHPIAFTDKKEMRSLVVMDFTLSENFENGEEPAVNNSLAVACHLREFIQVFLDCEILDCKFIFSVQEHMCVIDDPLKEAIQLLTKAS